MVVMLAPAHVERKSYGRCRCGQAILYQGASFCSLACQQNLSAHHLVGFDTETELIRPGCRAPHLICASFALGEDDLELVHWKDAYKPIKDMIESGATIVGHNLAFDFSVIIEMYPDLVPAIFEMYAADRVSDTIVREKLAHLARGTYQRYETNSGQWVRVFYNLAACVKRRLNIELAKEDTWRLRYGELKEVPLAEWPQDARDYPLKDAQIVLPLWEHQENTRDFLLDQYRQSRAAFWLQLMSCWGLHTDEAGVQAFARATQQRFDVLAGELKAAGLMKPSGVRDTKAVKARVEQAYLRRGVELPKTPKGGTKTDADTCERSQDPVLVKYSELSSLKKTISTDIPLLMQGIETPIHAEFEFLLETGRTSSSPNVQNLPTAVGVRECFVPRPGMVFAAADYSGFELRTWAQVCIYMFGSSEMAKALNAGNDPHLEMARRILGISYEEALESKKEDKVYKARQSGKVANFGFPGGLGAKRFVDYARQGYGVILTEAEAKKLKAFWLASWPEAHQYFNKLAGICESPSARIQQYVSQRWRGNIGYTDGCNGFFQALAADAAKNAGFLIARACYSQPESPLYGCKPVNFVHDEFIVEVFDDETAHDAAMELAHLMVLGASPFLPDVPPKAEPLLMRRWSKKAEPVFVDGRLVPWDWRGSKDG